LQYLDWNHQPLDLLPYLRLPTVFITTLGIVGVYYLLCALFDQRVALAGGLLLALDPWYLAHSRVLHHDALMTTFMTLSALALLLYVWRGPTRWPLLVSGVCAGLALLSKTLGLFLFPWTALLFVIALWYRRWPVLQVMIDGAVWSLTTWLTFFLLWPAMWLKPTSTLWRMRQMIETYAINPHEKAQFFLGQTIANPGPLFYLVVVVFALTPLVVVGLTAIGWAGLAKANFRLLNSRWGGVILSLVYTVAYTAFISLGEKKRVQLLSFTVISLSTKIIR